jgi:hypothetical protein
MNPASRRRHKPPFYKRFAPCLASAGMNPASRRRLAAEQAGLHVRRSDIWFKMTLPGFAVKRHFSVPRAEFFQLQPSGSVFFVF